MIFCLLTIILIGRLSGELSGALYSPDDLQLLCGEGEGGDHLPSVADLALPGLAGLGVPGRDVPGLGVPGRDVPGLDVSGLHSLRLHCWAGEALLSPVPGVEGVLLVRPPVSGLGVVLVAVNDGAGALAPGGRETLASYSPWHLEVVWKSNKHFEILVSCSDKKVTSCKPL